jgi:hypothetical protein
MKTYVLTALVASLMGLGQAAMAQYSGCPHGSSASGSQVAYLNWRFIDPVTGQDVTFAAPNPYADKVYRMEIYLSGAPTGTRYEAIGLQGTADGFKVFSNQTNADNNTSEYSDGAISTGIAQDVGSSNKAVFYIRSLPSSDPNWSGQLTAFKALGQCYPSLIGYPSKFYKKTLIFRN